MTPGKQDLGKMSRANLIKLAAKRLTEEYPEFDPKRFSRVQAFKSKEYYRIKFSNPVNFVPQNTCAYYGATALFGPLESVSLDSASNPEDFTVAEPHFHAPTVEEERRVRDVLALMDLPAPVDLPPGTSVSIHDTDSTYDITMRTKCEVAYLTIDKNTKEIRETLHKELAQDDEHSFTEITR
jgi:hypothetical protein